MVYGYDDLGATIFRGFSSNIAYGLAKFTSTGSQQLSKISTWIISENTTVDIEIYENFDGNSLSNLKTSLNNQICENPGYYTFDLPAQITINRGQNFFVKIKYNAPNTQGPLPCEQAIADYANPTIETGKFWVSPDGNSWIQAGMGTNELYDLCIKAYTIKNTTNIKQIVYFIDSDPGFGNGILVPVSLGNNITANFNIPLNNVPVGLHTVYFRAKDNNDQWSIVQTEVFYCTNANAPPNVTKMEYFLDTDPGLGNGNTIAVTPNTNQNKNIHLNLNSLALGFHVLYIRSKDTNNKWSVVQMVPFYNATISNQPNINYAEYFVDADPGTGLAVNVPLTNPSTNISQSFTADLSTYTIGSHIIYIRVRDSNNKWSLTENKSFTICVFPSKAGTPSGISQLCLNPANSTYTTSGAIDATSYIWEIIPSNAGGITSNGLNATIDWNNNYVGTASIIVKGHNSCGDGTESTLAITINTVPSVAGSITGSTAVCKSTSNINYTVPAISGATSYLWTLPAGATGTSTTNSISVCFGNTATSGNIKVNGRNNCGDGPENTIIVTVNEVPVTPVITLNDDILHSNAINGNQWYNQNGLVNGATNQDHNPTSNGLYYVIVTLAGCSSDLSNTINFVITGIEQDELSKTLKLYPNPVTNELIIEIKGNAKNTNFEIYNSKGQVVFKGFLLEKSVVQTASFFPGIYLIKFENGKTFEFKKIVKN